MRRRDPTAAYLDPKQSFETRVSDLLSRMTLDQRSAAALPWLAAHVPAVLEAWLPGEGGGSAIADVLFGDCNPGGKLPISLPVTVGQVPVYYNHKPSGGRSNWKGDYVGVSPQPLFAFGHGLSYTRFAYGGLTVHPKRVQAN
jgi:beta-glucosidase